MAKNTNIVVLEGYLTKDAMITAVGDTKKCEFTIGVNHGKNGKGETKTSFVPVQAWRQLAENVVALSGKGAHVIVTGELYIESWQTEGKWNSKTYIKAYSVRIIDSKKEEQTAKPEEQEFDFPWIAEDEPF